MPRPKTKGGLSKREQDFVHFYIGKARGNATKAARMAGYTDGPGLSETGSRLLRNADVRKAIDKHFEKEDLSTQELTARIAAQCRTNIMDYLIPCGDGKYEINMAACEEGFLGCSVKEFVDTTTSEATEGRGGTSEKTRRTSSIKLIDSTKALALAAKIRGLVKNDTKTEVPDEVAMVKPDEASHIVDEHLKEVEGSDAEAR